MILIHIKCAVITPKKEISVLCSKVVVIFLPGGKYHQSTKCVVTENSFTF